VKKSFKFIYPLSLITEVNSPTVTAAPTDRSGEVLGFLGGWVSKISRYLTHECGNVVSHTHRPPLLPSNYSWYSFLLQAESTPEPIVRPEGLCHWKIPVAKSGIEPATLRFVEQCCCIVSQVCIGIA
jgi:hypothetical protein